MEKVYNTLMTPKEIFLQSFVQMELYRRAILMI